MSASLASDKWIKSVLKKKHIYSCLVDIKPPILIYKKEITMKNILLAVCLTFISMCAVADDYQTKDTYGNYVNSKDSYQIKDAHGNYVNSPGCSK